MPTPSTVRPPIPADAPVLSDVQSTLREPSPTLLDAALAGTVGTLLVAADHDFPVGYLLAVERGVASSARAAGGVRDAGETVYIAELAVAPHARREGHASALLDALFERFPDAVVTLAVAPDNEAARSLYARFDFEEQDRLDEFYGSEEALLLRRSPGPE